MKFPHVFRLLFHYILNKMMIQPLLTDDYPLFSDYPGSDTESALLPAQIIFAAEAVCEGIINFQGEKIIG